MEKITKEQVRCAQTLIGKLKIKPEDKELMVLSVSSNRTKSVSGLDKAEGVRLIQFLKSMDRDEVKAQKMRIKIIALAHEMKWYQPVAGSSGSRQAKVDMKRVDGWCKEYGYLHKGLNSYTVQELPKLVTQMEAVYASYLNGVVKQ